MQLGQSVEKASLAQCDHAVELKALFFILRETRPKSNIYLLLDEGSPIRDDHPLHLLQLPGRPVQRERAKVTIKPEAPPDQWPPVLVQLYRSGENGYLDEELIDLSVATAIDRCSSVNGAYVAAWIASDLLLSQLATLLAQRCVLFDLRVGRRRSIPLYEPYRMALLLDDPEAKAFLNSFLSRIHLWCFMDVSGALRSISSSECRPLTDEWAGRLRLVQFDRQSRLSLSRLVMLGLRKAGLSAPTKVEITIDALLIEAARVGLSHGEDVVFFALNGLSLSPAWHKHPLARRCIEKCRDEGVPLSGVLGDFTDGELDAIGNYQLR